MKKYFILGLRSAWSVVFLCRIWLTWIKFKKFNSSYTTTNNKSRYFVTRPAYLSVEINAHNLLYLILLVKEKKLPPSVLHIDTFSSQPCESLFRNTRALSGVYSTIVNFTVHDFLRRAQRLSMLNDIKHKQAAGDSVNNFVFPTHHKHRNARHAPFTISQYEIDQLDIEKTITEAYDKVIHMLGDLEIMNILKNNGILDVNLLSEYVFKQLNSSSKMCDYSSQSDDMDFGEFDLADDDEDNDETDETNTYDNNDDSSSNDDITDEDEENDQQNSIKTTKTDFIGIRVTDKVEPHIERTYFSVSINDETKFFHKQSACWLLSSEKNKLSSDRLLRVRHDNKKK
jgi:hypothetical protein